MIVKGSTVGVYIYVMTNDGLPATGKASSITVRYFNNQGAFSIPLGTITITELSTATPLSFTNTSPGWYMFPFTFNYAGTVFMVFNCDGCVIAPWEEQVVDLSDLKDIKAGVLNWAVAGNTLTLYNDSGTSTGTYDITTDTDGNIVKVEPHTGS